MYFVKYNIHKENFTTEEMKERKTNCDLSRAFEAEFTDG